jgi:hypothetical protein
MRRRKINHVYHHSDLHEPPSSFIFLNVILVSIKLPAVTSAHSSALVSAIWEEKDRVNYIPTAEVYSQDLGTITST